MSTPEGKVKIKMNNWIKANMPGAWTFAPRGGPFGKAGTGDKLIVWRYTPVMIEVKADETKEATALQQLALKSFQQAGGVSCLLKGFEVHKLEMIRELCLSRAKALTDAGVV